MCFRVLRRRFLVHSFGDYENAFLALRVVANHVRGQGTRYPLGLWANHRINQVDVAREWLGDVTLCVRRFAYGAE